MSFYKVAPAASRHYENLGLRALESDWAASLAKLPDDLMKRPQFNLLYDIGVHLFGRNLGQTGEYAMYFMDKGQRVCAENWLPDPHRHFGLFVTA
jgi:hypothetical protein